jgi:hypothetical protein
VALLSVVVVDPPVDEPLLSVDPPVDEPLLSVDPPVDEPLLSVDPPVDEPLLSVDPPVDEPSLLLSSVDPLAYIIAEVGKINDIIIKSNNKLVIRFNVAFTIS